MASSTYNNRYGIFTDVKEAVAAAREAFEKLSEKGMADRKRIIDHIRRVSIDITGRLPTADRVRTFLSDTRADKRDRLIDELWGDEPPQTARNIIQRYISNLRRSLGDAGERIANPVGGLGCASVASAQ